MLFCPVLGIRDVWIRIPADPYLGLTDPDLTPDPTPFFSDFKDAKKMCFFIFFSYTLPAGTFSSVLKT